MIGTTRIQDRLSGPYPTPTLVDGEFAASDAKDLVLALLGSAARAHQVRNLRSQVRSETPEPGSAELAARLEAAAAELAERLARASAEGRAVRVRSTIELEIDGEPFSR